MNRRATYTPVTSIRIPPSLLARADELVPLIAGTGELVNPRARLDELAEQAGSRTCACQS